MGSLLSNTIRLFAGLVALIGVAVWLGCSGDPEDPLEPERFLEIDGLNLTSQTVNAGSTTTLNVNFTYSGDEADLIYKWTATGGQVIGDGRSVTYLAPDTTGQYTVTLELTDGFEIARNSVTVEVISQSLGIDASTHWPGDTLTPTLRYQINVTQLNRPDVMLHYEIVQDAATTGAFLSVEINGVTLLNEEAIGEVQPVGKPLITGDVDVSRAITRPGQYELTLSLLVARVVERGWLLQKAELIGAEGKASGSDEQ